MKSLQCNFYIIFKCYWLTGAVMQQNREHLEEDLIHFICKQNTGITTDSHHGTIGNPSFVL